MSLREKQKKYDINQCVLYKCSNKRRLESLLFLDKYELNKVSKLIDYYTFFKDKKDGDKREITAPRDYLKKIQKSVLVKLSNIRRPDWLISGEKGKSYIDNSRVHQYSSVFLTIDIKKFYDNCKREYVFRFFKDKMRCAGDVAGVLTEIVTFNGGIPTGCPTSQLIAYYAYEEMFENINKIASKYGCIFTLYVDDMTFSSKGLINPDRLIKEIDIELRKYGHKPKYKKVKYYPKGSHKIVTGVAISKDKKLKVANSLSQKIYNDLKQLKSPKLDSEVRVKILNTLNGRLQAARSVDNNFYSEVYRLIKEEDFTLTE